MIMTPRSTSALRRARRQLARGVTLIEVLIVVAILSMIAAGVTVAVLPKFQEAAVKNTETNAREIRNAVQRWRGLRGGSDCPSISQLVQDKEIDSASKTEDAWSMPYKIGCTEDDVIVSSAGPDKKEGTKDDIVVPKGAQHLAHDPAARPPSFSASHRPSAGRGSGIYPHRADRRGRPGGPAHGGGDHGYGFGHQRQAEGGRHHGQLRYPERLYTLLGDLQAHACGLRP